MIAKQCSSKLCARKEVRVTHIGNPRIVKANPSEFSAVVQSLTGLKKRRSSPSEERESCSKSKVPRNEGGFDQFCSTFGIHETALLPQMAHEESNSKHGGFDEQEEGVCEMLTDRMMMSTLDCFDGKIFPDILSFDFMSSISDVV